MNPGIAQDGPCSYSYSYSHSRSNHWRESKSKSRRVRGCARWLAPLIAMIWAWGPRAMAAIRTVTNLNDTGGGSLRAAIAASAGGDSINFTSTLSGTLTLSSAELIINTNLTITGPGAKIVSVSGGDAFRVFNLAAAGAVNISGLTIADGSTANLGGGILITNPASVVTVNSCTFADNNAHDGGGIVNKGTLYVTNSTFRGNGYDSGGGLNNQGTATVVNCTFSDNHSSIGAAIYNLSGTLTLLNCTITANASGGSPGGLAQSATVNIQNTVIAGNVFTGFPLQAQDVGGSVTSLGHNLIGKTNGSSGWIASDLKGSIAAPLNPLLGPLQDNGGWTFTAAPLSGSPAVDAGAAGGPATDQRGQPRPYDNPGVANTAGGNGSDVGAYEVSSNEAPFLLVYNTDSSGAGSLRQAIANVAAYNVSTIRFASNVVGTIAVTNGEMTISNSLSILGPGPNVLTVSANGSNRVFNVTNGSVNISGLTIARGFHMSSGAGINNTTLLNVSNCTFTGNSAADGGAIFNAISGSLTVINSTFATNMASSGGALENRSVASIVNCTLTANRANNGSAIYSSTVGTLTLLNDTIVRNGLGSDTYGALYAAAGITSIRDTLIALNTNSGLGGPDVTTTPAVSSQGFNLIGKTNNSTGWLSTDRKGSMAAPLDPQVGALQDNGGPTFTVALWPGSPAIDAGASGGPATDQRGQPRPYNLPGVTNVVGGNGGDIGAYELISPNLAIARSGTNAVLSWSTKDAGYTLEFTTNFTAVPVSWTVVPGMPAIVSGQYVQSNSAAGIRKFYRLRGP
jgi:Right handed beta helix region